jgi:hypothetical protein
MLSILCRSLRPVLAVPILVPLCVPSATAAEVYAYQGYDYATVANGTTLVEYSTLDSIAGDFTTSTPLAPNLNRDITPLTYSFGDGLFDWTNNNSTVEDFNVTTDVYGTVTGADIIIYPTGLVGEWDICTNSTCADPFVFGELHILNGLSSGNGDSADLDYQVPSSCCREYYESSGSNNAAGLWGPDFDPLTTPEPASFGLMFTTLMTLGFWSRRRITGGTRHG